MGSESSKTPALEFDRVALPLTWPYDTALEDVSFSIRAGELMLITLQAGRVRSPFADLSQALTHPKAGEIRCNGKPWHGMSPVAAAKERSRIGRVFDVGGWISNLDVDENVLLAQRHHNSAPARLLAERAELLAKSFGLASVPIHRPADASQNELRLSQWIRALLVDMNLLVLERPTRDVLPEAVLPFLEAIHQARSRGAAVLWITTDGGPTPPDVTMRCAMHGSSLVRVETA